MPSLVDQQGSILESTTGITTIKVDGLMGKVQQQPAAVQREENEAVPMRAPATDEDWVAACEHFRRFGFIYFEDFFSPAEVANINRWATEIASASTAVLEAVASKPHMTLENYLKDHPEVPIVVPEKANQRQVCRAEDFVTPAAFANFKNLPQTIGAVLAKLQGEDYVLFKEKINFKWPGGGAFPPHQDYPAYDFLQPGEHATAMLSVDPATVENGCLRIAYDWTASLGDDAEGIFDPSKRSAGRVVVPFEKGGKNNGTILEKYASRFNWKCLNTRPADLVIFSSYVPHYSEANGSAAPRRAFFLTYNKLDEGDHHALYYDKKRNDPQNPIFHIATPTVHSAAEQMM